MAFCRLDVLLTAEPHFLILRAVKGCRSQDAKGQLTCREEVLVQEDPAHQDQSRNGCVRE